MRRQKTVVDKKVQSEKRKAMRKEKSKEAARCRRGKEGEVFTDLVETLPLPDSVRGALDKSSIIRLAINYMKARHTCQNSQFQSALDDIFYDMLTSSQEIVDTLQGVVLMLSPLSDIVYVTENLQRLLGICQYDVIGYPLDTFIHPADWTDVENGLRANSSDSISFTARFKCTLSPRGRTVNAKSAMYKTMRFSGQRLKDTTDVKPVSPSPSYSMECIVLTATPIELPTADQPLDTSSFSSKHSLDLQFIDCDPLVTDLTRYPETYLKKRSIFDLVHTSDLRAVEADFKTLYRTEQVLTDPYRFLTFGGGYVSMMTQASLVNDAKTGKPAHIICLHHTLSEIEESDVVMAEVQMIQKARIVKMEGSVTAGQCSQLNSKPAETDVSEGDDEYDNIFSTTASCFMDADEGDMAEAAASMAEGSLGGNGSLPAAAFTDASNEQINFETLLARLAGQEVGYDADDLDDLPGLAEAGEDDLNQSYYLRAPYIPMDDICDWIKEDKSCCAVQSSVLPDLDSDSMQYRRPCSVDSTPPSLDQLKVEQRLPESCAGASGLGDSGVAAAACDDAPPCSGYHAVAEVQSPNCSDLLDVLNISMDQTSLGLDLSSYSARPSVCRAENPLHSPPAERNNPTTNTSSDEGSLPSPRRQLPLSVVASDATASSDAERPRIYGQGSWYPADYHCPAGSPLGGTSRPSNSSSLTASADQRHYTQSHRKRKLQNPTPPYYNSMNFVPATTLYTRRDADTVEAFLENLLAKGGGGGDMVKPTPQSASDVGTLDGSTLCDSTLDGSTLCDRTDKLTMINDLLAIMEGSSRESRATGGPCSPPRSLTGQPTDTQSVSGADYSMLESSPEWLELSELGILQDSRTLLSYDGGTLLSQDGGTLSSYDGGTLSTMDPHTTLTCSSHSRTVLPSPATREYEVSRRKRPKSLLVGWLKSAKT